MPSEVPAAQRFSPIHMPGTKVSEQERAQRKTDRGWRSQYINSQPVRNHITPIRCTGEGIKQIAKLCGTSRGAVHSIVDRRTRPGVKVLPSTATKILSAAMPPTSSVMPAGGQCVSAIGLTRRLRALVADGYTPSMLSHELGIAPADGYALFGHCDYVPTAIAQAVADLFNRLEMIPGPSDRARALTHQLGWAPPLAWDEDGIDDADTHLSAAAIKHVTFPKCYHELRELGVHDKSAIARRLGVKVDSLQRQLARHRDEVAIMTWVAGATCDFTTHISMLSRIGPPNDFAADIRSRAPHRLTPRSPLSPACLPGYSAAVCQTRHHHEYQEAH